MTPRRIKALLWLFDNGETCWWPVGDPDAPTPRLRKLMEKDGQIERQQRDGTLMVSWSLTDKGRRELHEAMR